jgi:hypothetical protein
MAKFGFIMARLPRFAACLDGSFPALQRVASLDPKPRISGRLQTRSYPPWPLAAPASGCCGPVGGRGQCPWAAPAGAIGTGQDGPSTWRMVEAKVVDVWWFLKSWSVRIFYVSGRWVWCGEKTQLVSWNFLEPNIHCQEMCWRLQLLQA